MLYVIPQYPFAPWMEFIFAPLPNLLYLLLWHYLFPIAFGIADGSLHRSIAFYVVYCFASTVVSPSPTELIIGMLASADPMELAQ